MLDPGPTPLYFQLKNIIKAKIDSGELKSNERLPTQAEIEAEYNVSRTTIRQALQELEREGFIYRIRGKGIFVTDQEGRKQLSSKGTIENLMASAQGTYLTILEIKDMTPPSLVADILGLPKKHKCRLVEAVRSSRKGPFGYANFYFPIHWEEQIPWDEYTSDRELLLFLEEKLKRRIFRASQTIGVDLAGKTAAKHIAMNPQDPVLVIRRDYFLQDGSALFVAFTYNRPDRYEYKVELSRI